MKKLVLEDDGQCFACGPHNLDGLRIDWKVDGNIMTGYFTPPQKFQGWKGVVHGGILATLLDEAMTRLACAVSGSAVTAEMTVRYVAPASVEELLYIRGEIVQEVSNLIELRSVIHKLDASGPLIARATGKAIKIL